MCAVLDYRVPIVVDGVPPQIVRIRPLLNTIVPRAIKVEAQVLGVHNQQVESGPARNTHNNTGRSHATGQPEIPGGTGAILGW